MLFQKIQSRCQHISISGWLKQAAAEKIEREENKDIAIIDKLIKGN